MSLVLAVSAEQASSRCLLVHGRVHGDWRLLLRHGSVSSVDRHFRVCEFGKAGMKKEVKRGTLSAASYTLACLCPGALHPGVHPTLLYSPQAGTEGPLVLRIADLRLQGPHERKSRPSRPRPRPRPAVKDQHRYVMRSCASLLPPLSPLCRSVPKRALRCKRLASLPRTYYFSALAATIANAKSYFGPLGAVISSGSSAVRGTINFEKSRFILVPALGHVASL